MDNKVKKQSLDIAKFSAYCEAVMTMPEPNINKGYLEAKNKIISEFWFKLDKTNDEIVGGADENDQLSGYFSNNEFDKAFVVYDKVITRIQTKLEKFVKPAAQLGPVTLPSSIVLNAEKSKLKLKPVDIPVFFGDYSKWISFKSVFDSMVHNDPKLDNLEKMHYLKSCVSGDAERIISQFDITEQAYPEAYKAITDRFHNEVILIDTHIINILSQPNLTTESSNGIKELHDVTTENIHALKSRPTLKEFLDFLSTRFHALGCQQRFKFSIESKSDKRVYSMDNCNSLGGSFNQNQGSTSYKAQHQIFPPRVHQSFHNSSQRRCPICLNENHSIFSCGKFRESEPRIRIDMVNRANLCQRCLRNHQSACNQREGCRVCGGNHHTFLHIDNQESTQATSSDTTQQPANVLSSHHVTLKRSAPTSTSIINVHHANISKDGTSPRIDHIDRYVTPWDATILLATALILIRPLKGKNFRPFRCLLDQGGEASHISESAVQTLGLTKNLISASMCGLGGVKVGSSNGFVEFKMGSRINQYFTMSVQAVVVPKVTNPLPSSFIPRTNWKHIEGLQLADPEFNKPAEIDVILGSAIYGYLLLPGLRKATPNCPVAQNTELGWILSGATEPDSNSTSSNLEAKTDKNSAKKQKLATEN